MPSYDNTDRGVLFSQRDRKTKDSQPDYRGKLNVAGVDYELAAWIKKDKNDKPFLSLKVQEPRQRDDGNPPF